MFDELIVQQLLVLCKFYLQLLSLLALSLSTFVPSAWAKAGTIKEFPLPTPGSQPIGITAGPDGNLWFTEKDLSMIGRITPSGDISVFPGLDQEGNFSFDPFYIASDGDNKLWFTEAGYDKIGCISSK
jgi:streptogramin lyase